MNHKIDPDVVFLDSYNLPNFDTDQFEGRIERPLSRPLIVVCTLMIMIMFSVFTYRSISLHVAQGASFFERSEKNRLDRTVLFAERGVIYDRKGVPLAWNEQDNEKNTDFPLRRYADTTLLPGNSHITGYITYPGKDSKGFYYSHEFTPVLGLEKNLNHALSGTNGILLKEEGVDGNEYGESTLQQPVHGQSIYTSIDTRVQKIIYEELQKAVTERKFEGGAGVLMDITNGELIAHVSYPEFSAEVMTNGTKEQIAHQLKDPNNLFFSRTNSGLFSPGSIVKPFISLAALREGIISATKAIYSSGSISIPNPYFPDKPSVYRDWRAHGYTDMRRAIAVSSDVYFYAVGGGYEDQKGLGIKKIDDYMQKFGFGERFASDFFGDQTGVIPTPEWKEKTFGGDVWRLGDTYHTSIGQFGFLITPIQAARAVATIATRGTRVEPTLIHNDTETYAKSENVYFEDYEWQVVQEGMRLAVEEGTTIALNGLPFEIAGKSGTAELGTRNQYVHTWVIGYYPYSSPRYAFAVMMDKGPRANTVGAPYIMRRIMDRMLKEAPEYMDLDDITSVIPQKPKENLESVITDDMLLEHVDQSTLELRANDEQLYDTNSSVEPVLPEISATQEVIVPETQEVQGVVSGE